jgi:peptidoglycan-associated lipoprotein
MSSSSGYDKSSKPFNFFSRVDWVMKFNKLSIVGSILVLSVLNGCSSTEETEGSLLNTEPVGVDGAATQGLSEGSGLNGELLPGGGLTDAEMNAMGPEFSDPNNLLSKRTIYFSYDSSTIKPDFIPVIAAHTQYLLNNPGRRVILEGHADERGSREYNIALGEQRAKAVYREIKKQGVSDMQLEVVSYGEEKPAVPGMDEASWQLNRRVEIVYQGQ